MQAYVEIPVIGNTLNINQNLRSGLISSLEGLARQSTGKTYRVYLGMPVQVGDKVRMQATFEEVGATTYGFWNFVGAVITFCANNWQLVVAIFSIVLNIVSIVRIKFGNTTIEIRRDGVNIDNPGGGGGGGDGGGGGGDGGGDNSSTGSNLIYIALIGGLLFMVFRK